MALYAMSGLSYFIPKIAPMLGKLASFVFERQHGFFGNAPICQKYQTCLLYPAKDNPGLETVLAPDHFAYAAKFQQSCFRKAAFFPRSLPLNCSFATKFLGSSQFLGLLLPFRSFRFARSSPFCAYVFILQMAI